LGSAQDYKRYAASAEVLLVPNAFVSGKKHVETGPLCRSQQLERIPPSVFRPFNGVAWKGLRDSDRRHMIKEGAHRLVDSGESPGPGQGCVPQIQALR